MGSGSGGSGRIDSNARRRRRTRALGVAIFALPTMAHAAPLSLDLEWRAPSGCPDRNAVRRYVEEMLGNAEPATSSLSARGGVLRVAVDRWTADLAMRSGSGSESTRSFEGPTCESVSRAAALVMALTLHPSELPPVPQNPPERDTRTPERSITARFARPALSLSGAVDVGFTPSPAYGGAATFGWSPWGSLRWEVSGAYFLPRSGTISSNTELGANVSVAAFALRGCYPLLDAAVSLAPCIGGGLDWLRASGFGARSSYDNSAVTTHFEAGGTILWNFTDFLALRVSAFGVVPMTRPEFIISVANGPETVSRPAQAALRATGGVELHF
jgi:hypothetical protein